MSGPVPLPDLTVEGGDTTQDARGFGLFGDFSPQANFSGVGGGSHTNSAGGFMGSIDPVLLAGLAAIYLVTRG